MDRSAGGAGEADGGGGDGSGDVGEADGGGSDSPGGTGIGSGGGGDGSGSDGSGGGSGAGGGNGSKSFSKPSLYPGLRAHSLATWHSRCSPSQTSQHMISDALNSTQPMLHSCSDSGHPQRRLATFKGLQRCPSSSVGDGARAVH